MSILSRETLHFSLVMSLRRISERVREDSKFVVAERPVKQARSFCAESSESVSEERRLKRESASDGFYQCCILSSPIMICMILTGSFLFRDVPSSAVLPIIRPALGRQYSMSDQAKAAMQGYLNHFLINLDIVNPPEVCKFLQVSMLSFSPEYGPKLKEEYVMVKYLPKIFREDEHESCCSCSWFSCCQDNWQKVMQLPLPSTRLPLKRRVCFTWVLLLSINGSTKFPVAVQLVK